MKTSEVREMSIADLQDRIQVERNRLETMKLNHAISPLENTSELRKRPEIIKSWKEIFVRKESA